jgi:hypothetical protein
LRSRGTPRRRFEPQVVKKRQRRLTGVDEIVLSLTARGLRTGEIAAHFQEVYGARVSKDTVSRITDKVIGEMTEWLNRPLERVYPVIFIDAMVVKVRDGQVANKPVYVVIGVTVERGVLEQVRLRRQDLRDELVTLLTDGPTSSLLSWAFERILRHPDEYARLQAVADAGEDDTYLDAVVKETMRLCPAAPIVVRKLLAPMELGGYTIPAGTTVAPCVHLVHRRPDIYPEPLRFRPERFLERPAGTYTWIPFGGGVRRCMAASYAQLLMKQVTRTVIGEVSLSAVDPHSERARKSAIAFVPHRHAMAIGTPRRGLTTAPVDASSDERRGLLPTRS